MNNADKPAAPVSEEGVMACNRVGKDGLTKREAFAMAAMQGLIGSNVSYRSPAAMAAEALDAADAVLKALEASND